MTVDRIGSSKDAAASIQSSVDASFRDSDSLLFHDFMNGNAIIFRHFIKFINTNNTAISKDRSTSFQNTFPSLFVR